MIQNVLTWQKYFFKNGDFWDFSLNFLLPFSFSHLKLFFNSSFLVTIVIAVGGVDGGFGGSDGGSDGVSICCDGGSVGYCGGDGGIVMGVLMVVIMMAMVLKKAAIVVVAVVL